MLVEGAGLVSGVLIGKSATFSRLLGGAGMARDRAVEIVLDETEKCELTALTRKHGAPQAIAERARIVLAAANGLKNKEIAAKLVTLFSFRGAFAPMQTSKMRESAPRQHPSDIETPRLLLRVLLPRSIRAGLSGDLRTIERQLRARVPIDLIQEPAVLKHADARLTDPNYLPWSARAIILKESMEMVGHLRFHSRPDAEYLHPYVRNAVEFGYVVFPAHRRRGYALEAVTGAMCWAENEYGVRKFVASVSPRNVPSLVLIAKAGFRKIGEYVDDEDGVEHIYLRDRVVIDETVGS
jgi:RimJ/RimL family protein N-acetyltransferase